MLDGLAHTFVIAFAMMLAVAMGALALKKHARDRDIARCAATIRCFEPLVDAWLLNGDTRLLDVPRRETAASRSVVEQLLLQTSAGHEELWNCAVEAFERLGYGEQHIELLRDREHRRRAQSAYMLGRFEFRPAEAALLEALDDSHRDVRLAAVRSLARLGTPSSIRPIIEVMKKDPSIAAERAMELLPRIGAETESIALDLLRCDSEFERIFAARLLGSATSTAAHDALERAAVCDEAVDVRAKAVAGLAMVARRKSAAVIRRCLVDEAWPVRAQAARAAGALSATSLCPALGTAMTDPEWWVRHNSASALVLLGPRGRATLEKMLYSPDRFAAETAAEALQISGACDEYIDAYLCAIGGQASDADRRPEDVLDLLDRLAALGATSRIADRLEGDRLKKGAAHLRSLLEVREDDLARGITETTLTELSPEERRLAGCSSDKCEVGPWVQATTSSP